MYSAYKLNKQGDNIQPWWILSYLEQVCFSMSSSNCCFLTCIQISQEAGQVTWYSHLFKNFPQFVVIHTVKWFGIVPKKGSAKECSNYRTIALISHASQVMLKILQARLQQYVNHELPDVQAGFRKGKGTRDQTANIQWVIKKAREFQKNIYFCFIDCAKVWMCRSQQTGKLCKRWWYQTTWPASWEICMQVKKQQLEPEMEQQTGFK